jgi:sugar phosphate isomerase/epimerase
MPHLSVSTWSLHRSLGAPAFYGPEQAGQWGSTPTQSAAFSLLELPGRIAAFGIRSLDLCHFHLPSCDAAYLAELRQALAGAGVTLWSLLIDTGDITHPTHGQRDFDWARRWVEMAGALGAKNARVIAGKQPPTSAALNLSLSRLRQLAAVAQQHGTSIVIENWFELTAQPEQVLWLLENMDGKLGLKLDFGNWGQPNKYERLSKIAPHAESCHSKASFGAAYQIERDDYVRCLDLTRVANFAGPHTLIYDDKAGPDEWRGLQIEKDIVQPYL